VRGQLPGAYPDHAPGGVSRLGDRRGCGDRAEPDPARGLRGHPGQPASALDQRAMTALPSASPGAAGAPLLDARLIAHRGGFRLDISLSIAAGEVVALLGPNG